MCQKCNYKVRIVLKGIISEEPENCFIQQGLISEDPAIQALARSTMRAVFAGMSIRELVSRLHASAMDVGNGMEAGKRESHKTFLRTIPFYKEIDEESPEYKKEVYGGLIE